MLFFSCRFVGLVFIACAAFWSIGIDRSAGCDLCRHFDTPLCATSAADEGPDPNLVAAFGTPVNGWPQASPGDPVYLTYSYQNLLDGGLLDPEGNSVPATQIRTAVEEAFSVWAAVAPLHFTEVPDDGLPYGQSSVYGTIRMRHRYINGPDPPTGNPTTKARAYFPGGGLNAGDVEFDIGDPGGSSAPPASRTFSALRSTKLGTRSASRIRTSPASICSGFSSDTPALAVARCSRTTLQQFNRSTARA